MACVRPASRVRAFASAACGRRQERRPLRGDRRLAHLDSPQLLATSMEVPFAPDPYSC